MQTQTIAKLSLWAIFFVVIAAGVICRYTFTEWPFARIGGFLGLIAVIALLIHQGLGAYGGSVVQDPNHWSRQLARDLAPVLLFLFLPLTVISAWYQIVDQSDSKKVENISSPDEFIKPAKSHLFGTEYQINGEGLLGHLKANKADYETMKSKVDQVDHLWFPQLLIVNCGAANECPCPEDYKQVDYRVNWNLNAGIAGKAGASVVSDKVNLCWREVKYSSAASRR